MSEPDLKPAEQNPWYLLATAYGEQTFPYGEIDRISFFNESFLTDNRRVWNVWALSDRTILHHEPVTKLHELHGPYPIAWSDADKKAVLRRFRTAGFAATDIPSPI